MGMIMSAFIFMRIGNNLLMYAISFSAQPNWAQIVQFYLYKK